MKKELKQCVCGSFDLSVVTDIANGDDSQCLNVIITCKKCGRKISMFSKDIWHGSFEFVKQEEENVMIDAIDCWNDIMKNISNDSAKAVKLAQDGRFDELAKFVKNISEKTHRKLLHSKS